MLEGNVIQMTKFLIKGKNGDLLTKKDHMKNIEGYSNSLKIISIVGSNRNQNDNLLTNIFEEIFDKKDVAISFSHQEMNGVSISQKFTKAPKYFPPFLSSSTDYLFLDLCGEDFEESEEEIYNKLLKFIILASSHVVFNQNFFKENEIVEFPLKMIKRIKGFLKDFSEVGCTLYFEEPPHYFPFHPKSIDVLLNDGWFSDPNNLKSKKVLQTKISSLRTIFKTVTIACSSSKLNEKAWRDHFIKNVTFLEKKFFKTYSISKTRHSKLEHVNFPGSFLNECLNIVRNINSKSSFDFSLVKVQDFKQENEAEVPLNEEVQKVIDVEIAKYEEDLQKLQTFTFSPSSFLIHPNEELKKLKANLFKEIATCTIEGENVYDALQKNKREYSKTLVTIEALEDSFVNEYEKMVKLEEAKLTRAFENWQNEFTSLVREALKEQKLPLAHLNRSETKILILEFKSKLYEDFLPSESCENIANVLNDCAPLSRVTLSHEVSLKSSFTDHLCLKFKSKVKNFINKYEMFLNEMEANEKKGKKIRNEEFLIEFEKFLVAQKGKIESHTPLEKAKDDQKEIEEEKRKENEEKKQKEIEEKKKKLLEEENRKAEEKKSKEEFDKFITEFKKIYKEAFVEIQSGKYVSDEKLEEVNKKVMDSIYIRSDYSQIIKNDKRANEMKKMRSDLFSLFKSSNNEKRARWTMEERVTNSIKNLKKRLEEKFVGFVKEKGPVNASSFKIKEDTHFQSVNNSIALAQEKREYDQLTSAFKWDVENFEKELNAFQQTFQAFFESLVSSEASAVYRKFDLIESRIKTDFETTLLSKNKHALSDNFYNQVKFLVVEFFKRKNEEIYKSELDSISSKLLDVISKEGTEKYFKEMKRLAFSKCQITTESKIKQAHESFVISCVKSFQGSIAEVYRNQGDYVKLKDICEPKVNGLKNLFNHLSKLIKRNESNLRTFSGFIKGSLKHYEDQYSFLRSVKDLESCEFLPTEQEIQSHHESFVQESLEILKGNLNSCGTIKFSEEDRTVALNEFKRKVGKSFKDKVENLACMASKWRKSENPNDFFHGEFIIDFSPANMKLYYEDETTKEFKPMGFFFNLISQDPKKNVIIGAEAATLASVNESKSITVTGFSIFNSISLIPANEQIKMFQLTHEGEEFTPLELQILIFSRLKATAEVFFKKRVRKLSLLLPCFFTLLEREFLIKSANMAGFAELTVTSLLGAIAATYLPIIGDKKNVLVGRIEGNLIEAAVYDFQFNSNCVEMKDVVNPFSNYTSPFNFKKPNASHTCIETNLSQEEQYQIFSILAHSLINKLKIFNFSSKITTMLAVNNCLFCPFPSFHSEDIEKILDRSPFTFYHTSLKEYSVIRINLDTIEEKTLKTRHHTSLQEKIIEKELFEKCIIETLPVGNLRVYNNTDKNNSFAEVNFKLSQNGSLENFSAFINDTDVDGKDKLEVEWIHPAFKKKHEIVGKIGVFMKNLQLVLPHVIKFLEFVQEKEKLVNDNSKGMEEYVDHAMEKIEEGKKVLDKPCLTKEDLEEVQETLTQEVGMYFGGTRGRPRKCNR